MSYSSRLLCRSQSLAHFNRLCSAMKLKQKPLDSEPSTSYVEFVKSRFPSELAALDRQLAENCDKPPYHSKRRAEFMQLLKDEVLNSHCRAIAVGSTSTNLNSGRSSDLDLVIFPTKASKREEFQKDFYRNADFRSTFMDTMASLIEQSCLRRGINVVSKSVLSWLWVPLLSLELSNGLAVDIQFSDNFNGLRNTNLLRYYASCDDRFAKLFCYFRTVFDALEVRNSKYGLLSSYHISLLCVHFLQSEQCLSPWTVLPILCKTHRHLVGPEMDIEDVVKSLEDTFPSIDFHSHNRMTTSELIIRFVHYYSSLCVEDTAIFIEKGLAAKKRQSSVSDPRLQIIDPYGPITVCRSHFAASAFTDALGFLRRKIKSGMMLGSFPNFPEAVLFKSETKWRRWRDRLPGQ